MIPTKNKNSVPDDSSAGKPELSSGIITYLLIAAVLMSIALMYAAFLPAYLSVSLLLFSLLKIKTGKNLFYSGIFFGLASSLVLNFWMIHVVAAYAKGSILLGLACYLVSAVVLGFFFGMQFYMYGRFRPSESRNYYLPVNALFFTCTWILFEWIRSGLFSAMPWLSFNLGITQTGSLFLIQPAAWGGTALLSFLMISASCFIAFSFYKKNKKLLFIAFSIFIIHFSAGWLLFQNISSETSISSEHKITVALALPGLSPETVWNENSADALVSSLFALNIKAVEKKTDLIVWSETVVPWTYSADDDFLKEISRQTSAGNSYTLIGMNSVASGDPGILNNSVYLLSPAGKQSGRYDKQDLLALVEKPLFHANGNFILPFLAASSLKMQKGGFDRPVETPWGKAGIFICNEATCSALGKELADKGASFFVNMGNDSWFSGSYIPGLHFYNNRLRAVENRKDILVNNNKGFAGVVKASGEISAQIDAGKSSVQLVEIVPNHIHPANSNVFIYLIFIVVFIAIFAHLINHKLKT